MTTPEPDMLSTSVFPSIWRGAYTSGKDWDDARLQREQFDAATTHVDDGILAPRHIRMLKSWCAACEVVTEMTFHWHFGAVSPDGSVRPAWTETGDCSRCHLNSRIRALISLVKTKRLAGDAFLAEGITPAQTVLSRIFRTTISSEYLGPNFESGSYHPIEVESALVPSNRTHMVRHEDLTCLSLESACVDVVITQDVFEHIPDYRAAFSECRRILRSGGILVFTIPFFPESPTTQIRAIANKDGSITHLAEPEIHGNPLGGGSLCFQHFGWDLLDDLRNAGFSHATAHSYWGPWQGHVLGPSFVFTAQC